MIRRAAGQSFLLIAQSDHAKFSGFLARHIGNERFTLLPEDAITAIGAHDAGWPLHDEQPTLNPAGLPLHVFETPPTLATRIWTASADRAAELGPYAALLVNLHQLALSALTARPQLVNPREVFDLNKFQHRQIERVELLRQQLGLRTDLPLNLGLIARGTNAAEDALRYHFRILTLCDRLSLELCCGQPLFTAIDDIPPSPAAEALSIQLQWSEDGVLGVSPWPFDRDALSFDILCRRVSATSFSSEEDFRAAYNAAKPESLQLELRLTPFPA